MSSALASQLTQRFFRYLAITSQSDPRATTLPTTAGQHAMAQALADELRLLGRFGFVELAFESCHGGFQLLLAEMHVIGPVGERVL